MLEYPNKTNFYRDVSPQDHFNGHPCLRIGALVETPCKRIVRALCRVRLHKCEFRPWLICLVPQSSGSKASKANDAQYVPWHGAESRNP